MSRIGSNTFVSTDPIQYSEVLADLTSRRESLNNRMSNIDTAIGGIRFLLEDGAVLQRPVGAGPAVSEMIEASSIKEKPISTPTNTPQIQEQANVDRRRKAAGLNVYVNPFPEWSRAMAKGKTVVRKQNGVRCPKCGSCDTRQSLTRGLSDILLFCFDFINARCRNCNTRFRVWRAPANPSQEQQQDFGEFNGETDRSGVFSR